MHIFRIHASLNVPKKHTLLEFMKDREKEYQKIKVKNMIDDNPEDLERCYQIMLYSRLIMVHIAEEDDCEYLRKADLLWKSFLDKDGKPDKAAIGLYIYRHGNDLNDSDLIEYHAYMELWERCEFQRLASDITENVKGEHMDKYHLFAPQVDVEKLFYVIKDEIIPCIKSKNYWFAVWAVLKDNGWIVTATERSFFEDLMVDWYGKAYKKKCMDIYASTCLSERKWNEWDNAAFLAFFAKDAKHLLAQKKASVETVRKMAKLCKQFEYIIKSKCIK